jgi:hypothetical protein
MQSMRRSGRIWTLALGSLQVFGLKVFRDGISAQAHLLGIRWRNAALIIGLGLYFLRNLFECRSEEGRAGRRSPSIQASFPTAER